MGNRCFWAWSDNVVDIGADDRTASSASDALSSRLPGPIVPGFQNCIAAVKMNRLALSRVRCGMTDSLWVSLSDSRDTTSLSRVSLLLLV
jgi:hypothetical protein